MQYLLVIDDDERLRGLLGRWLGGEGFHVTTAANADDAQAILNVLRFDLLVLDVMMPGRTGIELLETLRPTLETPVVLLTALGDPPDRIRGLMAGADDYVAKPFEPQELLLRIRSILRRARTATGHIQFGPFTFDPHRQQVQHNQQPFPLTGMEINLLSVLAEQPGEPVARESLCARLGLPDDPENRTLDVHVLRLRRKLGADHLIQTVRGKGYLLQGIRS